MFVSVIIFTIVIVSIPVAEAVSSVWVPSARVSDQVGNGVDDEVTEDLGVGTGVVEGVGGEVPEDVGDAEADDLGMGDEVGESGGGGWQSE